MFVNKHFLSQEELAERLWKLCQESYEFGSPWPKENFISDFANEQSEYIILLDEEEILGFIGYHWVLDEAEITNIVVKTATKGQGIGCQMIEELMDQVALRGVEHVFLEVRESNKAAQHLYKKEKFIQVGKRKHYYHQPEEDGIMMCGKVRVEKCRKAKH